MAEIEVISVNKKNVSEHGFFCVKDPRLEGHALKNQWLKKRFDEGLRIKIALHETGGQIGFIEYIPAEHAWRPVTAPGYIFIQCIMFNKKKYAGKGYASELVKECLDDAKKSKMHGVAVFTSDGPWLAGKNLFLNHGFKVIGQCERFELLVHQFKKSKLPEFNDWFKERKKYKGLNLIYANQCPFFYKSINDLAETTKQMKINLKVTELKTARQAQKAPSGYGVYTLINDGKLLADHYISNTRFLNIVKQEQLE